MKAIETIWKGYRFRSRTEARWAVFLEAAGIDFEYEPEGVILPSGPYLPDFRLLGLNAEMSGEYRPVWLEIKPDLPSDDEMQKCSELAGASGDLVLIACGQPDFREQFLVFEPKMPDHLRVTGAMLFGQATLANISPKVDTRLCLAKAQDAERFDIEGPEDTQGLAQLRQVAKAQCRLLQNAGTPVEDPTIFIGERLQRAYDAARSARFEFGQTDPRWKK